MRRWRSRTSRRRKSLRLPGFEPILREPGGEGGPLAHERAVHAEDKSLDDAFLKGAAERDLTQLKGHRSVGGMRASIYNAMPIEGVRKLVSYMKEFESKHG